MTLPSRLPARALALPCALALAGGACASTAPAPERGRAADEVLIEVLPRAAELTVDGSPLGRGAHVVRVADALHRYQFRAAAPGFEPAERVEEGARLAGARIALVLAPRGFRGAGPLDLDDGESLAAAAEALQRDGAHEAALEYAHRAAAASPDSPHVQRVLQQVGGAADRGIEVRRVPPQGSPR